MTNLTENKYFKWFLGALILLLITIALMTCNNEPTQFNEPIEVTYPLNEIIQDKDAIILATMENNKILRLKNDSLLAAKSKVVYRKVYIYDSLLVADTSCIRSLVTLYKQCSKVDSVNEYVIGNQVKQIAGLITVTNNQRDIIDIRNYQHGVDSVNEIAYKEFTKLEFKRGLRKGRKQGIVIGKVGEVIKDGLYLYLNK